MTSSQFVQSVVDAVNAAGVLGEVTFDRKVVDCRSAKTGATP